MPPVNQGLPGARASLCGVGLDELYIAAAVDTLDDIAPLDAPARSPNDPLLFGLPPRAHAGHAIFLQHDEQTFEGLNLSQRRRL